jgi:hypothetical protein
MLFFNKKENILLYLEFIDIFQLKNTKNLINILCNLFSTKFTLCSNCYDIAQQIKTDIRYST